MRGYWWSPRGTRWSSPASTRRPVQRWHIADPAHPDREPAVVAYPAAGTPNALVSAEIIALDGRRTPIRWDEEYLADVVWDDHGLLVVVQPRDQTALHRAPRRTRQPRDRPRPRAAPTPTGSTSCPAFPHTRSRARW